MKAIIEVKGLSKKYKLGTYGVGSFRDELDNWMRKLRRRSGRADLAWEACRDDRTTEEPMGKDCEDFWALKDVCFEIAQGETVGVIGRNGAGKSTLLKVLSRVTEPTSGFATLRGRIASLLEVGTGFHPDLTGRENVYLNGAILGMKKWEIDSKFDYIVEFSETESFIDTPVKRYSSGMYVRLAFSVAAHLEPEILVVDEVLAVGDFQFQTKCIEKMKQLTGAGKTILFVSHNLYTLQTLCKRGVLLSKGRVLVDGPMHQAIAEYRRSENPKTARDVSRWSSESVSLKKLHFNGSDRTDIQVDGRFDLDIDWSIRVEKECALYFGVSIKSTDGVYVCGVSTYVERKPVTYKIGEFSCGVKFPNLDLPAGSYRIAFAILNELGIAAHAYLDPACIASVSRTFDFDGVVGLPHAWCLDRETATFTAASA